MASVMVDGTPVERMSLSPQSPQFSHPIEPMQTFPKLPTRLLPTSPDHSPDPHPATAPTGAPSPQQPTTLSLYQAPSAPLSNSSPKNLIAATPKTQTIAATPTTNEKSSKTYQVSDVLRHLTDLLYHTTSFTRSMAYSTS